MMNCFADMFAKLGGAARNGAEVRPGTAAAGGAHLSQNLEKRRKSRARVCPDGDILILFPRTRLGLGACINIKLKCEDQKMKRFMLTTTALVFAGGMAAADTSVTGSAEMGVAGKKGEDARLHKDIRFKVTLSGATDTGVSFGAAAELRHAGKYQAGGAEGAVFISSAFGTLTLGNTDGAYDKALTETGMGGALTDDDTGHAGYNGNSGLDGNDDLANAGGSILRYDYALGNITTSLSGEFGDDAKDNDSSNSALGVGVAWSGDIGGIVTGVGVGYQTGKAGAHKESITGASVSVDMGNGIKAVVNASNHDNGGAKTTHTGIGVAYTAGPLTVAVNGGQHSMKGGGKNTGAGFSAIYNLGAGVDFKVGAGSGKKGDVKEGSWSAGLAFSF